MRRRSSRLNPLVGVLYVVRCEADQSWAKAKHSIHEVSDVQTDNKGDEILANLVFQLEGIW